MSTPLPPPLARLERELEAMRAPLPPSLRAAVLAATARARPPARGPRESFGWFAASLAVAAALLMSLSGSARTSSPDLDASAAGLSEACIYARAVHDDPSRCFGELAPAAAH